MRETNQLTFGPNGQVTVETITPERSKQRCTECGELIEDDHHTCENPEREIAGVL